MRIAIVLVFVLFVQKTNTSHQPPCTPEQEFIECSFSEFLYYMRHFIKTQEPNPSIVFKTLNSFLRITDDKKARKTKRLRRLVKKLHPSLRQPASIEIVLSSEESFHIFYRYTRLTKAFLSFHNNTTQAQKTLIKKHIEQYSPKGTLLDAVNAMACNTQLAILQTIANTTQLLEKSNSQLRHTQ